MPVPGLNADRCAARNRLACRRDAVNAAPVYLFKAGEARERLIFAGALRSEGTMPDDDSEALARINALRPSDAEPLTLDQVYLHYAEAANDNFVADRYLFLDESTLRNIARDAAAGTAFMNSHRTGGMSHPTELPFGKTFAGRFEEYRRDDGSVGCRALVGIYLLRGVRPNGDSGPSTDDLSAMIDGGTVFDVSVGLYGGEPLCDVCGNEIDEYGWGEGEECPHIPGTTYGMSSEQRAAQVARGVPDGCASYSLCNSRMGEVSAVYDGAVPGAGFRKALAYQKLGRLDDAARTQARHAYRTLGALRDFGKVDGFADTGQMHVSQPQLGSMCSPNLAAPQVLRPITPQERATLAAIAATRDAWKDLEPSVIAARNSLALDTSAAAMAQVSDAWGNASAMLGTQTVSTNPTLLVTNLQDQPANTTPAQPLSSAELLACLQELLGIDLTCEAPLSGKTFAEDLEAALSAVSGVLARIPEVTEMRANRGKRDALAADRYAQLESLCTELCALRDQTKPQSERAHALRVQSLRLQAAAVAAGA